MVKKTVAELLASGRKKQKKQKKQSAKRNFILDPPTDREIAQQVEKVVKFWLTTPGLPGTVSPDHPIFQPPFWSTPDVTHTIPVEGVPLPQTLWVPPIPQPKPEIDTRPRTDPQLINDEILSIELKNANGKARTKNGRFKKGWDMRKVMRLAQKECTKERQRLGLCKKKSTRKGQKRKTARRAYKK